MTKNKKTVIAVMSIIVFAAVLFVPLIIASANDTEPLNLRWDFAGADSSVLDDFTVVGENADEYSLKADGLHFGRNAGDVNGKRTDVQNLFLADGLSGSYAVETHIKLESAWKYPENQACLVIYDGHEDFVKLGFQGTSVALCYAVDGTLTNDFASVGVGAKSEMWLRIEKENNLYTAFYSINGENFFKVGEAEVSLTAAQAGFYVGWNGYGETAPTDVWFEYFSVKSLEDEVTSVDKTLIPNKETVKLEYGKSFNLSVQSSDAGAECGDITYASSDTSIATVSDKGVITAVGDGYATITVNSTLSGKCYVVVSALPELREYESVANPYMPAWEFVPDAEPYVFEDPDNPGEYRVYVYGSHDTQGEVIPCGFDQVVWSAPVDDLTKWRYDGVAFITGDYDLTANLYAPDICEIVNADGTKTYYFYPNATTSKQYYRVAKSDRPDGPFKVMEWSSDNPVDEKIISSDPAVFVDDNGRVYGYWGSSSKPQWVELDPATMATVKEGCTPKNNLPGVYDILDRNTMQLRSDYDPTQYNIVQDEHVNDWRFFEASSIRKVGNKYVFIFCRYAPNTEPTGGYFSQLAYGYSDSPEGPWTYGGVIVRNAGEAIPNGDETYADTFLKQNTHGSICQIGDEWYVFYHRGHRGIISRQAMAEKINVSWDEKSVADGGEVRIDFAEMTSKGFNTDGLDPYKTYSAGIVSYLTGNYEFKPNYSRDTKFLPILNIHNEVVAGIKYFNFSKNAPAGHYSTLSINLTPKGKSGTIDVYMRPLSAKGTPVVKTDGKITSVGEGSYKIGSFTVSDSMPWVATTLTINASAVDSLEGEWGLFLVFNTPSSYALCDLNSIGFGLESENHTESYTDNGNGTHSCDCSLCGKSIILSEVHKFVDGECVCGAEENLEGIIGNLYGYNVILSDTVDLNFYMILPDSCLSDSGAYMGFEINGRKVNIPLSEAENVNINGVSCYKFTLSLGYKELSDKITAKFVCEAGESREYSYSVKEYAGYIMKNKAESDEYKKAAPLAEAMLNYGAYTQKHLGHSKNNLANSECAKKDVSSVTSKTLEKYRITTAQGGELVTAAGSNLSLEPLTLRLYFNKLSDKALSFRLNGVELESGIKDNYIYVEIKGISLGSLDKDFKIEISDGETTEYVRYNLCAYLYLGVSSNHESFTNEFKDTLRALYLFNKAAASYK